MTDWTRRVDDEGKARDWVERTTRCIKYWQDLEGHPEVSPMDIKLTIELLADGKALVRELSEQARNVTLVLMKLEECKGMVVSSAEEIRIAAMQRVIDGENG